MTPRDPDLAGAMDAVRECFERVADVIRQLSVQLQPALHTMANVISTWERAGSVPLSSAQARALESAIRSAAREVLRPLGRSVRLGSLRQRLRQLGAVHFDETTMRGHLVVTTGGDAPEGAHHRRLHLILTPVLGHDRERWALYLGALALLDPHPATALAALDTTLRVSEMLIVAAQEAL